MSIKKLKNLLPLTWKTIKETNQFTYEQQTLTGRRRVRSTCGVPTTRAMHKDWLKGGDFYSRKLTG